jgi:DNA-binding transcriptional LysR family regulator
MPLVATSRESSLRINIDRIFEKHDFHPQIICESNDIGLVFRMVKSGFGYAIIPRTAIFSSPSLRKYCREPSLPDAYGEIGLSYSDNRRESIDDSNFVKFVKTFTKNFFEKYYKVGIEHLLNETAAYNNE